MHGVATFPLNLPDRPPFFGDLYFQWANVDYVANQPGLVTTSGLRLQVR